MTGEEDIGTKLLSENNEIRIRLKGIEGGMFGKQLAKDVFQSCPKSEILEDSNQKYSHLKKKEINRYYNRSNFIKNQVAKELEKAASIE